MNNHPIKRANSLFSDGWRSEGIDCYMKFEKDKKQVIVKYDIDTSTSRLLANMSKHEESTTESS